MFGTWLLSILGRKISGGKINKMVFPVRCSGGQQQLMYRGSGCLFAKSCLTLCDTINCGISGFPVFHYLAEFAQTYVYSTSLFLLVFTHICHQYCGFSVILHCYFQR